MPTLTDFFQNQFLPYIKPRLRSWKRSEQLFRLQLQDTFGNKRLNQLSRQQVQALHTRLLEGGLSPASCDHVLKLARRICSVAVAWRVIEVNPLSRIPLFNVDNRRERYVSGDDLERLLTVLRTDKNRPVCLIALFLLSTGARLNEALRATWDQIDRQNRVWRIPASNSKSKRVRSVPLNDSAINVLDQVGTEGKFPALFVNAQTGANYTTIHKVWRRLRGKAALETIKIHDLRHSYASFLINSGRTLYEVQQILGHSDPKVTQRYSHLSSKSLQDAANTASVIISGAMPVVVEEAGEVVPAAA